MATLRVDNVGAGGFLPDVEYWKLDANGWTLVQDARFRDNSVLPPQFFLEKFHAIDTLKDAFNSIFIFKNFGATWYVLCTCKRVYVSRATGLYDITPLDFEFSGNLSDRWQACFLNGFMILNNSQDEPYYWPLEVDSAEFVPRLKPLSQYPGESPWEPGQTCAFITTFGSALFAGNITNSAGKFPYLIKFSDFAEPGTLPQKWDAAPDNSAGQRDIAEGQDEIIGGLVFKNVLYVRKRNSVFQFRFIGGQYVYQRQQQTDQVSCINKHCVVNTDNFQLVVGDNDIYVTQGLEHRSPVKGRVKEWFFGNLNKRALDKIFCLHDSINSEIWIMAPHGESEFVNVALIWNYEEDTFTTRTCANYLGGSEGYGVAIKDFRSWDDLPGSWAEWGGPWGTQDDSQNRKRLFFTKATEVNVEQDEWLRRVCIAVPQEDGVEEVDEILLERMHIPFPRGDVMDWESIKQISFVSPKCRKADSTFYIDLWLGVQKDIDSPIRWYGPKRWRPGRKGIAFDKSGRFISLRARLPINKDFRLTGYDIEYRLVSKR